MGSLTPGVGLIYERVGDVTYAREVGSDPSTRVIIGAKYNTDFNNSVLDRWELEVEWKDILTAAKSNAALQTAIERVKIIYHLSKENE
jgi:hypothetical protein